MSEFDQDTQEKGQSVKFDINTVINTARSVITSPATYFQNMQKSGGLVEPLIFIAVIAVVTGVLAAVLSIFFSAVGFRAFGLGAIIFVPIGALIGAFIGAGILFAIWKLMGSEQDYEASFRCIAATMAIYPVTTVLSILPYIGSIAAVAWATYLLIEASVAVHGRNRKTAQLVFGVIGAVLVIMNVSSEHTVRQLGNQAEELSRIMEQNE
jgi:hypothetical protein